MAQLELERVTDLIRGDPTMGKYIFTLNHQKIFFKEGLTWIALANHCRKTKDLARKKYYLHWGYEIQKNLNF